MSGVRALTHLDLPVETADERRSRILALYGALPPEPQHDVPVKPAQGALF